MNKYYFYPLGIRLVSFITISGQFGFVIILIYLTTYLYPDPRAIITGLLSIYFIYILVKAIKDLMYYFPTKISLIDGLVIVKFLFGGTRQIKMEDIISIAVKCKNEPFHTTIKLRDKSIIGIGRSMKGREEIVNSILHKNNTCKLFS